VVATSCVASIPVGPATSCGVRGSRRCTRRAARGAGNVLWRSRLAPLHASCRPRPEARGPRPEARGPRPEALATLCGARGPRRRNALCRPQHPRRPTPAPPQPRHAPQRRESRRWQRPTLAPPKGPRRRQRPAPPQPRHARKPAPHRRNARRRPKARGAGDAPRRRSPGAGNSPLAPSATPRGTCPHPTNLSTSRSCTPNSSPCPDRLDDGVPPERVGACTVLSVKSIVSRRRTAAIHVATFHGRSSAFCGLISAGRGLVPDVRYQWDTPFSGVSQQQGRH
jgi:hypothetical protein